MESSELRYQRMFETTVDGLLFFDADSGQITDANPALLEMLGCSREQIIGSNLAEAGLFKDRRRGPCLEIYFQFLEVVVIQNMIIVIYKVPVDHGRRDAAFPQLRYGKIQFSLQQVPRRSCRWSAA